MLRAKARISDFCITRGSTARTIALTPIYTWRFTEREGRIESISFKILFTSPITASLSLQRETAARRSAPTFPAASGVSCLKKYMHVSIK